jgi:hypothetical protein
MKKWFRSWFVVERPAPPAQFIRVGNHVFAARHIVYIEFPKSGAAVVALTGGREIRVVAAEDVAGLQKFFGGA